MSHRREQLERALQRIIGKLLSSGLNDPRISGMVSVTGVSVSPDLRQATVKVSVLPETKQHTTLHGLKHAAGHIQSLVLKELRTRAVPHLQFQLDTSLKKQAQVLTAIRHAMEDQPQPPGDSPPAEGEAPRPDEDSAPSEDVS